KSRSMKRKLVAAAPIATPPRYTGESRCPITAVSTSPSRGTVILEKIIGSARRHNALSEAVSSDMKKYRDRKMNQAAEGPQPVRKRLQPLTVADYANSKTFNGETLLAEIHHNRGKLVVFRQQLHGISLFFQALNRDFVINTRNHNLAVAHILGVVNRQQIAIKNTDIFHRHPTDAQQEIGARLEHARVNLIVAFDMLLCQQRFTRSNTAHQWDARLFFHQQTNAARRARDNLNHAFTRQRFKVFFGSVWRTEAQTLRDFRTRGWHTRLADMIPNEIKHLLLPGR